MQVRSVVACYKLYLIIGIINKLNKLSNNILQELRLTCVVTFKH